MDERVAADPRVTRAAFEVGRRHRDRTGAERAAFQSGGLRFIRRCVRCPPPRLRPLRLQPNNLYVVLGSDKEIAYWKNNEGWFVNVGTGYQSVKRAPERLPEVGNFVLVEGYVVVTDAGRRLKALRFKELTGRGVLNALIRSETEILEKAKTRTTLSQAQKRFMLEHIRKNYFYEFTDDAPEIIEYLTGYDAHMTSVGEFVDP